MDYKNQIDIAHKKAMSMLQSFDTDKQKSMENAVNMRRKCSVECLREHTNGNQDNISAIRYSGFDVGI